MNLSEITSLTEDQARTYLETIRWPAGAACPHCGEINATKLKGKSTRPGVYKCKAKACRKQFTVTVGTIFERSHISLRHWVIAFHLMCASKKGISAHQLHRMLGLCYKSAWFMCHRIRHAMSSGTMDRPKFEGTVEMDETYVGGKPRYKTPGKGRSTRDNKTPVVALVERGGGVRAVVMPKVTAKRLRSHLRLNAETEAVLNTDQHIIYNKIGREQSRHDRVHHTKGEYARGEAHINTAESFFSLLKRGVYGTFHHCEDQHLHRYVDEFAFRWDNRKVSDSERRNTAVMMAEGKRLTYVQPCA